MSEEKHFPEAELNLVKNRVLLKHPWFSYLVLSTTYMFSEAVKSTLSTKSHIYINPDYFNSLSIDEKAGAIIHECLHLAFLHHTRRKARNKMKWAIACDLAINGIIIESKTKLPEHHMHIKMFDGMSAEEISNHVEFGENGYNIENLGILDDYEYDEDDASKWKDILSTTHQKMRQHGIASANIDRIFSSAIDKKLNWKEILPSMLSDSVGGEEYTWKTLNRRSFTINTMLPGRTGMHGDLIAICVDTSGSMSDKELAEAIGIIRNFSEEVSAKVMVIEADSIVCKVTELQEHEEFTPSHLQGGGGTSFIPAIKYAEEHDAKAIVYITDLMGDFPAIEPEINTIWLTKAKSEIPFGRIVLFD